MMKFDFTDNAVKVIAFMTVGITFCIFTALLTYSHVKRLDALERCYEAAIMNQKLTCNF
jgi:hypothetical protein